MQYKYNMRNEKYLRFSFVIATLVLLFVFPGINYGQEVTFVAEAPKVVRAGEQFQLTYTLNVNVDEFTPPNFGECKYLGGPMTGSSTSFSVINGRTTRSSSYTFTYYLQAPSKDGKIILNAATGKYKRNEIKSNTVEIEVVSSGKTANTATGSNSGSADRSDASVSNEDIYVRLECDKQSVYVGEQITAWIKIYSKLSVSEIEPPSTGSIFSGFYQQEVELPPLTSLQRERVGDDIYGTGVLRKVILYPQKSGEIIIEPFDLGVIIQKQSQRRPQSIFDEFFGPQFERVKLNLKSNRLKLNVKPLPGNQPAGFTGAVGKFQISGNANLDHVKTNDAITFTVTVSGKGNLKLIEKVNSEFPPAFDVFDPLRKARLDNNNQGKSGKLSFEYTVIPRHPGEYTIPPFSLVYFDPEIQKYVTVNTQSFQIFVEKGDGDTTTIVSGNLSKEDIELLGSDIRYIETKTQLRPQRSFIFGSMGFYLIYALFICIFLAVIVIRRERIKRSADIARYRNKRAGKVAVRRLKKARSLLKANNKKEFYDELEQALWNYLSDKLRIPFSELSKEKAEGVLKERAIDENIISDFIKLINTCEFARYAPGGMESERSEILDQSVRILNKLDQNL